MAFLNRGYVFRAGIYNFGFQSKSVARGVLSCVRTIFASQLPNARRGDRAGVLYERLCAGAIYHPTRGMAVPPGVPPAVRLLNFHKAVSGRPVVPCCLNRLWTRGQLGGFARK